MSDIHITGQRDGTTFEPKRDQIRLNAQMLRVYQCMSDEKWRTLHQISYEANAPEASVSARLRDLRKSKFGGFTVERECLGNGLHQYRLLLPKGQLTLF